MLSGLGAFDLCLWLESGTWVVPFMQTGSVAKWYLRKRLELFRCKWQRCSTVHPSTLMIKYHSLRTAMSLRRISIKFTGPLIVLDVSGRHYRFELNFYSSLEDPDWDLIQTNYGRLCDLELLFALSAMFSYYTLTLLYPDINKRWAGNLNWCLPLYPHVTANVVHFAWKTYFSDFKLWGFRSRTTSIVLQKRGYMLSDRLRQVNSGVFSPHRSIE